MKRQFDDLQLGSIELFMAAELSSFTAAAAAAGVTPAAVSRSVQRLEERLGVRLFVRTTRQIRLTDEGRAYFEESRQALAQLVDAERQISGQHATPAGRLRVSLPTPYAHYRVLPVLPEFRERYPEVDIDVHISNRNVDFADDTYDLSVRGRAPDDSTLIARKLEDAEMVVVATPAYLRRHGTPATLDDLATHQCIQFERPSSGRRIAWTFRQDGQDIDILTSGACGTSEDALGAPRWRAPGRVCSRPTASSWSTICATVRWWKYCSNTAAAPARSFCFTRMRAMCRGACALVDFLVEKFSA
jgi:DNA-binding transcriptional LysR family regulator